LAERAVLPVFHSLGSYIDTATYEEALSALVTASSLGSSVKGITYVGYNCERFFADDMLERPSRFCYYTRKEGRCFLWYLIIDEQDAAWALSELWQNDPNFRAWLKALGFD